MVVNGSEDALAEIIGQGLHESPPEDRTSKSCAKRMCSAVGQRGLERVSYPQEAIHEIVTKSVVHRDYSIADDIHIRIFDDRVEVESPGRLPAHVTPENILDERFARNGKLVRLLNKYPSPPNKDVGEGLNTAFQAMRKLGLKEPTVQNKENSVLVTIRHEKLASREEIILEYLEKNDSIANKRLVAYF